MIPKKIHYCWFGGNPLPELAVKCIESWKKYCPDYEIIEWNEKNYDIKNKCEYVREAYEVKKWAFVSDYARYDILYQYGGLYFDTDVELIKSIEKIVEKGSFMGFEFSDKEKVRVAPGLGFGVLPNLKFLKEILDYYNKLHFVNKDGSYNQTTIVEHTTNIFKNYGLKKENKIQKIEDITIYPTDYFCPLNYRTGKLFITDKTISIHHYTASWHTEKEKKIKSFEERLYKKYDNKKISYIINNPIWKIIRSLYIRGLKDTLKKIKEKI